MSLSRKPTKKRDDPGEIVRLRDFAAGYAYCPCCEQDRKCLSGCTFSKDAPDGYARMVEARVALYGEGQ